MSQDLGELARRLRRLPEQMAEVARASAETIETDVRDRFYAGQTVYGDRRPEGRFGPVDLLQSGKLEASLRAAPVGTRIRVSTSVPYGRYMIRFGILPRGGAGIPASWNRAISDAATKRLEAVARGES